MNLSILYRGPLESCNYGCPYCPFAKHTETKEEHLEDERALSRFVQWAATQEQIRLSVFFTPWGEALIHKRYQQALARLTNMAHVEKSAIQTNLSCSLSWLAECNLEKLGLWCTFHPGEVSRQRFLERCHELIAAGARFSVGVVGLKEHFAEIIQLRQELPAGVYLWVNAFKRQADYYNDAEVKTLAEVDPLFALNNTYHASLGRACRCGDTVIAVDGEGTIRRCHFIAEPLGNIYESNLSQVLRPTPCTNRVCGCHIGYVHMNELGLYDTFAEGVLERIPAAIQKASSISDS